MNGIGDDDKPYTVLAYGNGAGYYKHKTCNGSLEHEVPRKDITGLDTSKSSLTLSPLSTTKVAFTPFVIRLNHFYWERNVRLKIMICNYTNIGNFHRPKFVGRGSKTQL